MISIRRLTDKDEVLWVRCSLELGFDPELVSLGGHCTNSRPEYVPWARLTQYSPLATYSRYAADCQVRPQLGHCLPKGGGPVTPAIGLFENPIPRTTYTQKFG